MAERAEREVKTDRAGWNVSEFVSKRGAWLTALHHVVPWWVDGSCKVYLESESVG